ncbi:MAG: hypothetical protein ABSF77_08950 [Spirochaetia bacterium]
MRYELGISTAVLAGIVYNLGVLVMKRAVSRLPRDRPLGASFLRSPLWIAGLALQFAVGVPLNFVAVLLIGPALVPGLMAVGLVVLALAAVLTGMERPRWTDFAGVTLFVLAVFGFSLSRLAVDTTATSPRDPALLLRGLSFIGAEVVLILGCTAAVRAARGVESAAGVLFGVQSGLLYSLGASSAGFVTGVVGRLGRGPVDSLEILIGAAALFITAAGSALGVLATQHALRHGRVVVTVALQNAIGMIVPLGLFFLVYRPFLPTAGEIAFVSAGSVFLIAGILLLTRRLESESKCDQTPILRPG